MILSISFIFLQETSCENTTDDDFNSMAFECESQQSQPSTSSAATTAAEKSRPGKRRNAQPSTADVAQAELIERCAKVLAEEEKPKDPLEIFGDYVVSQLRRFEKDELLQIETQNSIQKTLMDATAKYIAKKYLVVDTSGNLQPYTISTLDENEDTSNQPMLTPNKQLGEDHSA